MFSAEHQPAATRTGTLDRGNELRTCQRRHRNQLFAWENALGLSSNVDVQRVVRDGLYTTENFVAQVEPRPLWLFLLSVGLRPLTAFALGFLLLALAQEEESRGRRR